jgi:hypothetical protein
MPSWSLLEESEARQYELSEESIALFLAYNWSFSGIFSVFPIFSGESAIPCYTRIHRRIRSEVLACFGNHLHANFLIAFAVNQYRGATHNGNRHSQVV